MSPYQLQNNSVDKGGAQSHTVASKVTVEMRKQAGLQFQSLGNSQSQIRMRGNIVTPSKTELLILLLVLGVVSSAVAQTAPRTAMPFPTAGMPKAIDHGALAAQPGAAPISVTIVLSLSDPTEAENLLKALSTPGNPQYHKFLTADQFAARFAPAQGDVAKVIASLAGYGLAVEQTTALTLKVTGMPADMERAFGVSLHSYEVPAHESAPDYTYHAPLSSAAIPDEISASVAGVVGLDSRPNLYPHSKVAPKALAKAPSAASPMQQGNAPGTWTVTDFANYYDVQPLYQQGLTGKGRTLGILTLAGFTPSDAFAYWKAIGLKIAADRLSILNVDGGPGAPSDVSGSIETTLDVEQSGGVAPGAKIIVYQAPNTNQGFIDLFAEAVDANSADSLSTSWGQWEWLDNLENAPVTDPATARTTSVLRALHELLVRAGLQGQTVFAAAGDGGAYDANDSLGCFPSTSPSCSEPLSVDYPASDAAITAGGGTTLAGLQQLCLNKACTPPYYNVYIPHERVWAWDYLKGLCVALGTPDPITCGIFPSGGGGGVSVSFPVPSYQVSLPGIQLTQPGQYFVYEEELRYALPPSYAGRNVPDVSFNADPDTGYAIYYTSSVTGYGIQTGWGGTSFIGPQLNGITALLGQHQQCRLGLLNYALYELGGSSKAYAGPDAPFHAITHGDNWFYQGARGYNPAVGFGAMDVANFASSLFNLQ
jgi:kumamolisin